MNEITVITTNKGKVHEIAELFIPYNIKVTHVRKEKVEIQADDIKEIVKYAAQHIRHMMSEPFIIEDAGLFINKLKGFPGPYSSYIYKTIGPLGLLKLLKDEHERSAEFRSAIAFHSHQIGIKLFEARVQGRISNKIQGSCGFGFDPIFIPAQAEEKTFAQMKTAEKNLISHRGKAVKQLIEWLNESQKI